MSNRLPLSRPTRRYNGVWFPLDRPSPINVRRLDLGVLNLLAQMNRNGIEINVAHFERLRREYQDGQEAQLAAIESHIGKRINPESPKQVAQLLYQTLCLRPENGTIRMTESGGLSTDDESLNRIKGQHPVVGHIIRYRELDTLLGNFVHPLLASRDQDGRVRTVLKYTTASTGRLASGDRTTGRRNLQNLPVRGSGVEIRKGFNAGTSYKRDGKPVNCLLVSNDLSQIEMVLTAEASGDRKMRSIFERGEDMHDRTACAIFHLDYDTQDRKDPVYRQTMRLPAKTMGFLIVYGGGAANLQAQIVGAGGPFWPVDQCGKFIEQWLNHYSGVRDFMLDQTARARRWGYVWDLVGRVRPIPECLSAIQRVRNEGERAAGNMPIQGGAQAVIKLAMAEYDVLCQWWRDQGKICNPLLQIHDELLTEVEEDIVEEFREQVRAIMTGAVKISIPVNASSDVAFVWGNLK